MASPLWIHYSERTHGVNSNGYADVSNRPSRTIWANFTNQHIKTGVHKDMIPDDYWLIETGTYTGDGNDDRTITLSNANLSVLFLRIFSEEYAYSFWVDDTLLNAESLSLSSEGYASDNMIQVINQTGTFQIGSDVHVNENLKTYYYVAYGIYDEGGGGPE